MRIKIRRKKTEQIKVRSFRCRYGKIGDVEEGEEEEQKYEEDRKGENKSEN